MRPRLRRAPPALRLAAALALAASAASGAEIAQPVAPPAPTRLDLRPVTSFWQHLEEGDFHNPRGVAYDRKHDEVWVADTGNQMIGIFTADGLPLYSGRPGEAVREPSRLIIDGEGRALLLDNDRSRIVLLDWRGQYAGTLPLPGLPEHPAIGAVALDAAGNLYVGENTAGEVVVYDPERKVRFRFGSRGSDPGQFQSIAGIAVDDRNIVVVDHQVLAVQVFDRHGNFVRGFGKHEMAAAGVSLPSAVTIDPQGRIVLVDALRHEIKVFTREGKFVGRFGGHGTDPGHISFPVDVVSDGQGRLFVAEQGNGRVQVFAEVEVPIPPKPPRLPRNRRRPPA